MTPNNISAIIVDDEKDAIETLSLLIKNYCPEVNILTSCNDVLSAYTKINELKPDLVFLDIDLGKKNSFELLNLFENIFFKIIFITGHNDFAIKAIKYSALDYLLKPVDTEEFIKAINKAKENLSLTENYGLLKSIYKNNQLSDKMILNSGSKHYIVNIADIMYCEAEKNYTTVYTTTGQKVLVSKPIIYFEEILNETVFFRVHKSYILNINHISSYSLKDGGSVFMKNNQEIPISFRKKQEFFDYLFSLFKK